MDSKQKIFGFQQSKRIIKPEDFRRVFKTGKRFNHRFFNVYYLSGSGGTENARLGVAVGKRYFRKAVSRNRLKRLIRESFRYHAPKLPPMDIIVVARSAAAEASAHDLFACLAAFFSGSRPAD